MSILIEDFEMISKKINFKKLCNSNILITGAAGFIGSVIVKYLDYLNKNESTNISIVALVRDMGKAKNVFGECNAKVIIGDVTDENLEIKLVDYIFHCAASTQSKKMIEFPIEVFNGIEKGTQNILNIAKENKIKSMVNLSSIEVYGKFEDEKTLIKEESLGEIDIFNARSCYPLAKRGAEHLCYLYFSEYKVPVKTARLAQTFGPGVLKNDNRVFMQFAKSVIEQKDIVLHTTGETYGNYCYSGDLITALFKILLEGDSGEAYNVVNEDATLTISKMAEIIANEISDGNIKVIYDIPKENIYGYPLKTNNKFSSEKIRGLGWETKYGIKDMYLRMLEYLNEPNIK